ncbi:unnamed protein product [Strongylus vulgaris]|uniref:PABS domain-containing protein n=1 Tax=Strongylus vulgaris TaxID=40348 RepID=A0A3P7J156_STRVU|nr:unnamed protein product [Strongylus vulgaris]
MFISGTVDMTQQASAKVLSLGLGGGNLNSYLHHNYPNMNITVVEYDPQMLNISKRWFNLKLDNMHRVILADGLDFLKQTATKGTSDNILTLGITSEMVYKADPFDLLDKDASYAYKAICEKYDVILLDACGPDNAPLFICPADAFVGINMAKNFSKLLNRNGALIVNILSSQHRYDEAARELLRIYKSVFKNCILKKSHSISNLVMTCMHHPTPKDLGSKYEKFANYAKYCGTVSEPWST